MGSPAETGAIRKKAKATLVPEIAREDKEAITVPNPTKVAAIILEASEEIFELFYLYLVN